MAVPKKRFRGSAGNPKANSAHCVQRGPRRRLAALFHLFHGTRRKRAGHQGIFGCASWLLPSNAGVSARHREMDRPRFNGPDFSGQPFVGWLFCVADDAPLLRRVPQGRRSTALGQTIESSICADGSPDPSDVCDYEVERLWRAVRTKV
jgi:hypothetical protein